MSAEIMVVDDSEDDLDLLQDILSTVEPGIEILTATNGRDALRQLRASPKPPKLLLLDLRLPGMSGIEVLKELKADVRLRHILVCALSNGDLQEDICECYGRGAALYFKKPTGLAEMQRFAECLLGLIFHYASHCAAR